MLECDGGDGFERKERKKERKSFVRKGKQDPHFRGDKIGKRGKKSRAIMVVLLE
jgi:hypothetical protein